MYRPSPADSTCTSAFPVEIFGIFDICIKLYGDADQFKEVVALAVLNSRGFVVDDVKDYNDDLQVVSWSLGVPGDRWVPLLSGSFTASRRSLDGLKVPKEKEIMEALRKEMMHSLSKEMFKDIFWPVTAKDVSEAIQRDRDEGYRQLSAFFRIPVEVVQKLFKLENLGNFSRSIPEYSCPCTEYIEPTYCLPALDELLQKLSIHGKRRWATVIQSTGLGKTVQSLTSANRVFKSSKIFCIYGCLRSSTNIGWTAPSASLFRLLNIKPEGYWRASDRYQLIFRGFKGFKKTKDEASSSIMIELTTVRFPSIQALPCEDSKDESVATLGETVLKVDSIMYYWNDELGGWTSSAYKEVTSGPKKFLDDTFSWCKSCVEKPLSEPMSYLRFWSSLENFNCSKQFFPLSHFCGDNLLCIPELKKDDDIKSLRVIVIFDEVECLISSSNVLQVLKHELKCSPPTRDLRLLFLGTSSKLHKLCEDELPSDLSTDSDIVYRPFYLIDTIDIFVNHIVKKFGKPLPPSFLRLQLWHFLFLLQLKMKRMILEKCKEVLSKKSGHDSILGYFDENYKIIQKIQHIMERVYFSTQWGKDKVLETIREHCGALEIDLEKTWEESQEVLTDLELQQSLYMLFAKGRPFWYTRFSNLNISDFMEPKQNWEVIKTAILKLRGFTSDSGPANPDWLVAVAVLSVRARIIQGVKSELASSLVSGSLAVIFGLSNSALAVTSEFISEPVVAEGACHLLNFSKDFEWVKSLEYLVAVLKRYCESAGKLGELHARLHLLLCFDQCVIAALRPDTKPELQDVKMMLESPQDIRFSQTNVLLKKYLEAIGLDKAILGSLEDLLFVCFTHFICLARDPDLKLCQEAVNRCAAFQLRNNSPADDLGIPVFMVINGIKIFVGILAIQVKNNESSIPLEDYSKRFSRGFTEIYKEISLCGFYFANLGIPVVCSFYLDIGSKTLIRKREDRRLSEIRVDGSKSAYIERPQDHQLGGHLIFLKRFVYVFRNLDSIKINGADQKYLSEIFAVLRTTNEDMTKWNKSDEIAIDKLYPLCYLDFEKRVSFNVLLSDPWIVCPEFKTLGEHIKKELTKSIQGTLIRNRSGDFGDDSQSKVRAVDSGDWDMKDAEEVTSFSSSCGSLMPDKYPMDSSLEEAFEKVERKA